MYPCSVCSDSMALCETVTIVLFSIFFSIQAKQRYRNQWNLEQTIKTEANTEFEFSCAESESKQTAEYIVILLSNSDSKYEIGILFMSVIFSASQDKIVPHRWGLSTRAKMIA